MDAGYKVVFDKNEKTGADVSYMLHKASGKVIKSIRKGNVWVIEAYVDADHIGEGFARRE